MAKPVDCPESEHWQSRFDDAMRPDEQERYERHLSSCLACQTRLDEALGREAEFLQLGRRFGDPTEVPTDPTLVQVLEQLTHLTGLGGGDRQEAVELYFLRPADRPGLLGLLGNYEAQKVIGQGGMGVVLKAHEPALHRPVAIKVLSPALAGSATARRRFRREAQAAAAVCHEHIVPVYGVHEADGLPYLVMQYVSGTSLQDRLDHQGPLEIIEVAAIGYQTASGLAAAHAQGLIHRDIKPANLLLEEGLARVKITDFGLARMTDDAPLTQAGVVAGTPEYMAPEQARGEPVDHRADLFSLGSVLYAMCTGVPPFRGTSAVAILRQVSDDEPEPIDRLNPKVPDWLAQLIGCLLAKSPAERPQSAAQVAELLKGYLMHLRQPELPPPLLPARAAMNAATAGPPKKVRSRPVYLGFGVVLSLVVAIFSVRYTRMVHELREIGVAVHGTTLVHAEGDRTPTPGSFLETTLGNQAVPGVRECGFHSQERDRKGIPVRWTDGHALLGIPLGDDDRPRALLLQLGRPQNSSLRIRVNQRELVNLKGYQDAPWFWETTLDLSGVELGRELVLEILSDTITGREGDARALGVFVRGIRLLRTYERLLGVREVIGVAESGFYGPESLAGQPCRWTNGAASLTVPLPGPAPRALALDAWIPEQPGYHVRVRVNGTTLFDDEVRSASRWSCELPLAGVELGESLRIELDSSTIVPSVLAPGRTDDDRTLGVRLMHLRLLTDRCSQNQ